MSLLVVYLPASRLTPGSLCVVVEGKLGFATELLHVIRSAFSTKERYSRAMAGYNSRRYDERTSLSSKALADCVS
jgi:hypothetical protein